MRHDARLPRTVRTTVRSGAGVPRAGLGPARSCEREILSLLRIPISPPGQLFLVAKERTIEAQAGIEPANSSFAENCLTTWRLRHKNKNTFFTHSFQSLRSFRLQ